MNRINWFGAIAMLVSIAALVGAAWWALETQLRISTLESQVDAIQKAVIRLSKPPMDPFVCAQLGRRLDEERAKGSNLVKAFEDTMRDHSCFVSEKK
jgi:hypothetical protein